MSQTKKKQMRNLTRNASKLVENWLVAQNNEFGWFEPDGRPAKEKLDILGNRIEPGDGEAATEEAMTEDAETAQVAESDDPAPSSDAAAAAAAAAVILDDPEVAPPTEE